MELLTELAPIGYGLVAGVLGALLGGQLQRRLAYQRGLRHGQLLSHHTTRDYWSGLTTGVQLTASYVQLLQQLKEKQSQPQP